MPRPLIWLTVLAATILPLGLLSVVFALLFPGFVVDHQYFPSLGYGFYVGEWLVYRSLVLAGFIPLFFIVLFVNFWWATQFLGRDSVNEAKPASGPGRGCQHLPEFSRRRLPGRCF